MDHSTDTQKLAIVLNRASQQGKAGFCKMLWDNQPDQVQTALRSFLTDVTLQAVQDKSQ